MCPDIFTKRQRSHVMSLIAGKDTGPELAVRSLLYKMGFRFRLHRKDLPGRPDIVLPRYKTTIFVNGCFWHRHSACKDGRIPKSRVRYWERKLAANVRRDREALKQLKRLGLRALTLWECEIEKNLPAVRRKLLKQLRMTRPKKASQNVEEKTSRR